MNKLFILVLVCIVIFFTPLSIIWALNTLFNLSINYTVKTWVASLILGAITSRTVNVKKN